MSDGQPATTRKPKRRAARPLVAAVTILIILGVAATGYVTIRELQVQRSVYARILQEKLEATRNQFRAYLAPFGNHLATMETWQEAGLLDPADPARLRSLLIPLVDPTGQAATVYVIPATGPVFRQVRSGDGWVAGRADSTGQGCRDQEWYAAARAGTGRDPVHWSEYGPLPGDGRSGLVAARAAGGTVVALGLLKNDLDRFAATAPITENGILVRRTEEGRIIWLSPRGGHALDTASTGELLVSGLPEHAVISSALIEWGKRDRPFRTPFRFRQAGQTWWATFFTSEEGTDPGQLGLIAPADDLSRRLETVTGKVTLLFAGLLALAMVAVVALAFDYRNKWQRFARRKRRAPADEAAVAALIAGGETSQVEFKSTMRWNLRADKPGKEIELAWLKSVVAYLNTDGGFLLIGVDDDGEVLGLEADKFANDDKFLLHFDNLIKQHVGLEFAGYISGNFRSAPAGRLFLINCDRCPDPVFLRNGDEEKFFIRLGPSTRRLPASKILDYMAEREDR
ncbi:MAG: ATP-binding protein [Candidatus Krumholzibacteriota bacterium]